MNVLVTGGAGYIGSHTIIALLEQGHSIVIIDNLINSSREVVSRIEMICKKDVIFYDFNMNDKAQLNKVFDEHKIDAVVHFAGLKAVAESIKKPLEYYRNNIDSTLTLLDVMRKHAVKKLVFSSSATVYGTTNAPYRENDQTGIGITNPYGWTKYIIEKILYDMVRADGTNEFTILRYFNPIGAHSSGLIGEQPRGIPNNLMPYLAQVAAGKHKYLTIFGNDYDTPDGTGVRDYIHVIDLAEGHVAALSHCRPGMEVYNLGSGRGISVLDLVHTFETASGQIIPYKIAARRSGDIAMSYADVSKAKRELGWQTSRSIKDACCDSWNWQRQNPKGCDTNHL